ncbi:MAG TPA: hypothetical protein VGZ22_30395 [Isosphaeraceae bacterium]|nr:hypothetical protein [Isosphaeraceae bacterium]
MAARTLEPARAAGQRRSKPSELACAWFLIEGVFMSLGVLYINSSVLTVVILCMIWLIIWFLAIFLWGRP